MTSNCVMCRFVYKADTVFNPQDNNMKPGVFILQFVSRTYRSIELNAYNCRFAAAGCAIINFRTHLKILSLRRK